MIYLRIRTRRISKGNVSELYIPLNLGWFLSLCGGTVYCGYLKVNTTHVTADNLCEEKTKLREFKLGFHLCIDAIIIFWQAIHIFGELVTTEVLNIKESKMAI